MHKYLFFAVSLTLFGIVSLSACHDASCVVGRQTSCACPGGEAGVQVCLDDATYGACDCEGASVGPATGSGGMGSSTTMSGGGGSSSVASTGGAGGMDCAAGETLCGSTCVNLKTDAANCGACAMACPTGTVCSEGKCACGAGKALCGGRCIDVASDSQNCGACNHDCLGASCTDSLCEATVLATLQDEPYAITLDSTNVYIVSGGVDNHIVSVPLTGGNTELIAGGEAAPRDIAVEGDMMVWTNKGIAANGGEVVSYEIQNQVEIEVQTSLTTGVWAVALQGDYVYWANQSSNVVSRSDISMNQTLEPLASAQGTPWDLAVNGTHVYWTNYEGSDLRRVPIGGGAQDQIATGLQNPTGIAIDATHVYWVEEGAGRVARTKLDGGSVQVIATGQSSPAHVAVDGAHVYWTNFTANGGVMRAPLDGGDVVPLAAKQDKPYAIAVKDGYVYWSNLDGGQVMRVAK